MKGKNVMFLLSGVLHTGKILLVYSDAIASGTNEYVKVTYLLIETTENDVVSVRPRDIAKILR